MTSLPSRLKGIGPALESLAAQTRRPDLLVLALPRRSAREGRPYELPDELLVLLSRHSWMEVHWASDDFGPGTKIVGSIEWVREKLGDIREGDILMVLDDDHSYVPWALEHLVAEMRSNKDRVACSYFAYFYRGLMVPQGADIIALALTDDLVRGLDTFHREFVVGDGACFLVDDLWLGMFLRCSGREVVSLRDHVVSRGLETVYSKTGNADVEALMDLRGDDRRDRVTLRAFDGLLARLLSATDTLRRLGGDGAEARLRSLASEVRRAEQQIAELEAWLAKEVPVGEDSRRQATERLKQLRHLYRMQ